MRIRSFLPALMVTFFLIFSFLQRAEAGVKRIAVLDFEDAAVTAQNQAKNPLYVIMALKGQPLPQNDRGKTGRAVADILVTELVKDGTFKVIERNQLEKILSEQKLSISGAVDPSEVARLGKILGVSAVITGSVTQFSTDTSTTGILGIGVKTTTAKVAVNARMIDTTTGEILVAVQGSGEESKSGVKVGDLVNVDHSGFENSLMGIATKKAIEDIIKQVKEQSAKLKESSINAAVAYVEPSNKTIIFDAGKDQGVEKDQMFYAIKVIKEIKSPTTGEIIKRIMDVVAEFKVTEVDKSSATAAFVSGGFENIKEGDKISSSK